MPYILEKETFILNRNRVYNVKGLKSRVFPYLVLDSLIGESV